MFSQRNNPYCELLQIGIANIGFKLSIFIKDEKNFGIGFGDNFNRMGIY